jgi:hypothetical protein
VTPQYDVFEPLALEGENRKVRALEVDQLRLRTVASGGLAGLFRGPYGVAEAAGAGPLAAGSSGPLRSWRGRTRQEVPLSLAGTWFFVPEPTLEPQDALGDSSDLWGDTSPPSGGGSDGERMQGRLVLLIANGGDPEMGEKLLAEADRALRDEELRKELTAVPADEEDEPAAVSVAAAEGADQTIGAPAENDDDPWA